MEIKINAWTSYTINCLALFILIGFATYVTQSFLCLIGLVFLHALKHPLVFHKNSKDDESTD
jgi:hypothetical protein